MACQMFDKSYISLAFPSILGEWESNTNESLV